MSERESTTEPRGRTRRGHRHARLLGEDLTYPGAERHGDQRLSRAARRRSGAAPAMIVIHEAGGLGEHIRDVANRFANLGYVTLGVDLYTREGGPPPMDDLQALMTRLFSMSDARVLGDLEGAADLLRAREDVNGQGRLHRLLHGRALHAAVRDRERPPRRGRRLLGRLHRQSDAPTSARRPSAPRLRSSSPRSSHCPLLAAIGAEDHNPSPELGEQLRERASGERPGGRRSTSTRAPATRSSPTTARATGPSPRRSCGRRSCRSSHAISKAG